MAFAVFDNGRPAVFRESGWTKYQFDTFEEAVAYANRWLGVCGPLPGDFKVGEEYDYNGYGDIITIRFIKPAFHPAFTISELLAVILICSIIVFMIMPTLSSFSDQSKQTSCKNNLRQLSMSYMIYSNMNRAIPYPDRDDGKLLLQLEIPIDTWKCPGDKQESRYSYQYMGGTWVYQYQNGTGLFMGPRWAYDQLCNDYNRIIFKEDIGHHQSNIYYQSNFVGDVFKVSQ